MNIYALNPTRVAKLGLPVSRMQMLGEAKAFPGLGAYINAAHESVEKLVSFLTQLHATPEGVMSQQEKLAVAWKAAKAAAPALRAARERIEAEAKDLAEEVTAEAAAYWRSVAPDTATKLRAMEMLGDYVGKGQLENVKALMSEPEIAAVMATTNRRLIHPGLAQTYQETVTRGALKQFQPAIIEKADKAEELLDLAKGYTEAVRIVDYAVSSQQAAAAWDSRPQAPAMPEPVAT